MMLVFDFFLPETLLKFALKNSNLLYEPIGDPEIWEKKLFEVSETWIFSLLVASIGVALAMLIIKWLMKKSAKGDPRKEIWPLSKTLIFFFIGLLLVIPVAWIIYLNNLDYRNYIGVPGLVKSIVFISWLIYLSVVLVFHLIIWRSDFYARNV